MTILKLVQINGQKEVQNTIQCSMAGGVRGKVSHMQVLGVEVLEQSQHNLYHCSPSSGQQCIGPSTLS